MSSELKLLIQNIIITIKLCELVFFNKIVKKNERKFKKQFFRVETQFT